MRLLSSAALVILLGVTPTGANPSDGTTCAESVIQARVTRSPSPVTTVAETVSAEAAEDTVPPTQPPIDTTSGAGSTTPSEAPHEVLHEEDDLVDEGNDADGWDAITGRLIASGWQPATSDTSELKARAQMVFDASVAVREHAERRLADAHTALQTSVDGLAAVEDAELLSRDALGESFERASLARSRMAERALEGFVQGGKEFGAGVLGAEGNPAVAKTLARAASASAEAEARAWTDEVVRSGKAIASLACARQTATARIAAAEAEVLAARTYLDVVTAEYSSANIRLAVLTSSAVSGAVFPIDGPVWYGDTWHAPRSGGRKHLGVDFIAAWGTPILAVENGVIVRKGWDVLGGWRVSILGDSGTYYYYAHLAAYAAAQPIGYRVSSGEVLGWVGDTGNATGTPHLHWEVHPFNGEAVNPYPFAAALQRSGNAPAVRGGWLNSTLRATLPVQPAATWPEVPVVYETITPLAEGASTLGEQRVAIPAE
jgi:murein DD-endopeptidase MepM/ murein hydrolase activator NlpD